ncbi:MAG: 16S rRNA (cytosine(1402)-N(4))-methyltransferase [Spirochaetes bacterium]|nr:16S rRNA (cytosine(1402)-N(4))-methyltransferase [Spirochaetota bacterium]
MPGPSSRASCASAKGSPSPLRAGSRAASHRPCQCGGKAELRLVTGKPLTASEEEIARNPSSRSAKLRVAEKTDARARGAAASTRAMREGGAA